MSRLKWRIKNGRRKMCVNFKTDTDKGHFCCVPLPNLLVSERQCDQSEVDRKLEVFDTLSICFELQRSISQEVHCSR